MEYTIENLNNIRNGEEFDQDCLLDSMNNIINQAAALSRYFWPVNKKDCYQNRGSYLRSIFSITDDNPLKQKDVRNAIEHFDERLDKFTAQTIAGTIYPNFVGMTPDTKGVPFFAFRAYYLDKKCFEVLGEAFYLDPIYCEIVKIHNRLIEFKNNGLRFI